MVRCKKNIFIPFFVCFFFFSAAAAQGLNSADYYAQTGHRSFTIYQKLFTTGQFAGVGVENICWKTNNEPVIQGCVPGWNAYDVFELLLKNRTGGRDVKAITVRSGAYVLNGLKDDSGGANRPLKVLSNTHLLFEHDAVLRIPSGYDGHVFEISDYRYDDAALGPQEPAHIAENLSNVVIDGPVLSYIGVNDNPDDDESDRKDFEVEPEWTGFRVESCGGRGVTRVAVRNVDVYGADTGVELIANPREKCGWTNDPGAGITSNPWIANNSFRHIHFSETRVGVRFRRNARCDVEYPQPYQDCEISGNLFSDLSYQATLQVVFDTNGAADKKCAFIRSVAGTRNTFVGVEAFDYQRTKGGPFCVTDTMTLSRHARDTVIVGSGVVSPATWEARGEPVNDRPFVDLGERTIWVSEGLLKLPRMPSSLQKKVPVIDGDIYCSDEFGATHGLIAAGAGRGNAFVCKSNEGRWVAQETIATP